MSAVGVRVSAMPFQLELICRMGELNFFLCVGNHHFQLSVFILHISDTTIQIDML